MIFLPCLNFFFAGNFITYIFLLLFVFGLLAMILRRFL